jgi:hypothetical protein
MTDEQQLRSLLTRAAELPEGTQPPVGRLLEAGHRRLRLRIIACSVFGLVAVTAAAFALPALLSLPRPVFPPIELGGRSQDPVTAGELSHFHWSALPPSPLGPRSNPILTWTGSKLIELGGVNDGMTQYDGAVFDPATGRWRAMARIPNTIGLKDALSVWTGRTDHQLFVTDGLYPSRYPQPPAGPSAGLYDPATNRWTATSLPSQMAGLQLASAAWTGHEIVLAATAEGGSTSKLAVAAYTPATKRWRMITPRLPAGHPSDTVALVSTSHRVILWSLWSRTKRTRNSETIKSGIDVLALRHGRWTTVTGAWPQDRVVEEPSFAGGQILIPPGQIWCGPCPGPFSESQAKLADSGTLALTTLPTGPLVTDPLIEPPIWLWNGRAVVAGQVAASMSSAPRGNVLTRLSRMAAYDPATDRWTVLPGPHGTVFMAANPLWANREILLLAANGDLLAFHGRR